MSNGQRGVPGPQPASSITHCHRRAQGEGGGEGAAGGVGESAFDARPTSPMIHSWSFVLLYVARRERRGGLF